MVTLRIEDGRRVYEVKVPMLHKKLVLMVMEGFLQWMKLLVNPDERITYDEERRASPIVTLLDKWINNKLNKS